MEQSGEGKKRVVRLRGEGERSEDGGGEREIKGRYVLQRWSREEKGARDKTRRVASMLALLDGLWNEKTLAGLLPCLLSEGGGLLSRKPGDRPSDLGGSCSNESQKNEVSRGRRVETRQSRAGLTLSKRKGVVVRLGVERGERVVHEAMSCLIRSNDSNGVEEGRVGRESPVRDGDLCEAKRSGGTSGGTRSAKIKRESLRRDQPAREQNPPGAGLSAHSGKRPCSIS